VIIGRKRNVTWLTPKLCGGAAPNTPQNAMPAISKGSTINILWTANKCYALSLPLSGTASAARTLADILVQHTVTKIYGQKTHRTIIIEHRQIR
jgi:hypothetical protein